MHSMRKILKSGALVSFGLLVGRLLGFGREVLLAHSFGVSSQADAAVLILTLPDLLNNILIGGALGAVLVPLFSRQASQSSAWFWQSSMLIGSSMSLLALCFPFYANFLLRLLAPGILPEAHQQIIKLLHIAIWSVPLTTLIGVTRAWLQGHGRFAVSAFGTAIYNSAVISGFLIAGLVGASALVYLSFAVVGGAALRWGTQCLAMVGTIEWRQPLGREGWLIDRKIFLRYLHAVGAGAVVVFLPAMARALASYQAPGSIALLNYTTKLVELPSAICLSAFSVVLLPRFSKLFAHDRTTRHACQLAVQSLTVIWVLAWGIVGHLLVFAHPVANLVYGWGGAVQSAVPHIGDLLRFAIFLLPAQGASILLVAIYNAKLDTRWPFRVSLLTILVFSGLGWGLLHVYGLDGLLVALAAAYWLMLMGQLYGLVKIHHLRVSSGLFTRETSLALLVLLVSESIWAFVMPGWELSRLAWGGMIMGCGVVSMGLSLLCLKPVRQFVHHFRQKR